MGPAARRGRAGAAAAQGIGRRWWTAWRSTMLCHRAATPADHAALAGSWSRLGSVAGQALARPGSLGGTESTTTWPPPRPWASEPCPGAGRLLRCCGTAARIPGRRARRRTPGELGPPDPLGRAVAAARRTATSRSSPSAEACPRLAQAARQPGAEHLRRQRPGPWWARPAGLTVRASTVGGTRTGWRRPSQW